MAAVSYSGFKTPRTYGVAGTNRLAAMSGNTSMQPINPNGAGFQAINAPAPLDALSRVLQNGQNVFTQIAPPAAKPPAPPTAPAPSTPAPSSTYQNVDLSQDPILQQIKAVGLKSAQDAAAGGLANAKNYLINYGGVSVPQSLRDLFASEAPTSDALLGNLPANSVLAALNDAGTAQAAAANPFSTTKQLEHAHNTNVHNIDQASNLANLYYSSTHANQLGDENQSYLGAQNSALANLANLLSGVNQGELGAIDTAHQNYLNALPDAYARALAASPVDTSGGTGGTGSTTPSSPVDVTTPPPVDNTTPPPATQFVASAPSNTANAGTLFQLLQRRNALAGSTGGGRTYLA